jgi:hypothetical protein
VFSPRPLLCFLVLLFLLPFSSAQASININADAVQKTTVVFLYSANDRGEVNQQVPEGTGFFVEIPLRSDPKRSYRVLVTARHIVDPVWAKCGVTTNPVMIYARLNKKDYKPDSGEPEVEFVPIRLLDNGEQTWIHHSENDIDAAVVVMPGDLSRFDIASIPIRIFPTDEEVASQSIGDPVVLAGLLPAPPGGKRNYPVFKFGNISDIPHEDIQTRCQQNQPPSSVKVWLITAKLVSGNSGSPIFHVPLGGSGVVIGDTRPILLGVQSVSVIGADVAGMTPISFVFEILQRSGFSDADFRRGTIP